MIYICIYNNIYIFTAYDVDNKRYSHRRKYIYREKSIYNLLVRSYPPARPNQNWAPVQRP